MSAITDHPYRHIQKKHGAPALIYTEFTAVERIDVGDADLLKDFLFDESQRPVLAQIYGHRPDLFRRMAVMLCELGFDGIDINMGCPSRSIVHRGSGAGLIRTPELALEIVAATRQGVTDWQNGARLRDDPDAPKRLITQVEERHALLPAFAQQPRPIPVSLKTRIGYEAPEIGEWIPRLLEAEPAAIALHGRTLRQGYGGSADWEALGRAAEFAGQAGIPLLGNGDVSSLADAERKIADHGLDGVLIGRASYGNPLVFTTAPADPRALLHIALEHAELYERIFSHHKRYYFIPMRKHLSWYVRGVPSAAHLRRELMQVRSRVEATTLLATYLETWRARAAAHASPSPSLAAQRA